MSPLNTENSLSVPSRSDNKNLGLILIKPNSVSLNSNKINVIPSRGQSPLEKSNQGYMKNDGSAIINFNKVTGVPAKLNPMFPMLASSFMKKTGGNENQKNYSEAINNEYRKIHFIEYLKEMVKKKSMNS